MEQVIFRFLIVVLAIWLSEKIIAAFSLSAQANKILLAIVIVFGVLYLVFGNRFTPLY